MERKDETYSLMAYAAGFLQETQRRGQRRCPSKYGILTAKFHLLGAPLKPLRLWSAYRPCKACSLLCPKANPPLGPRQGRTIAEQSSASRPVCWLAGPWQGPSRGLFCHQGGIRTKSRLTAAFRILGMGGLAESVSILPPSSPKAMERHRKYISIWDVFRQWQKPPFVCPRASAPVFDFNAVLLNTNIVEKCVSTWDTLNPLYFTSGWYRLQSAQHR